MKGLFLLLCMMASLAGNLFAQTLYSATNSLTLPNTNNVSDWGRGFRFTPNQNIWVVKLGKNVPASGSYSWGIWKVSTQTELIKQTSQQNSPGSYVYEDIDSVIELHSGQQYILELYGSGSAQYYYGASSQVSSYLTYVEMDYCNSCSNTTYPTNTLTNYQYGIPDFMFSLNPPVRPNDAGISDFPDVNNGYLCSGLQTMRATITNYGNNLLDSVQVGWSVNAVSQGTQWFHFNPALDSAVNNNTYDDTTVNLGTYTFVVGQTYNIKAWTSTPNGVTDSANNNDTDWVTGIQIHPTPDIQPSSNAPQCAGNTLHLNVNGNMASYSWAGPNGFTSNQQNTSIANTTTNESGTYSVTITDFNGCSNTGNMNVVIFPNPIHVNIGSDTLICANEQILLNAQNPGDQYQWSTGASSQTIQTTDSGTYSVLVSNANGCHERDTMYLGFRPQPHVTGFNFIPKFYDQLGEVTFSLLDPIAVQKCAWDFGDGSPTDTSFTPTHTFPVNGGQFLVKLTVSNDCGTYETQIMLEINTETGIVKTVDPSKLLSIYPNPAKDFLQLQTPTGEKILNTFVYDFSGRLVGQFKNKNNNKMTIETQNLPQGVYLLRVQTNFGWITRKFDLMK